MSRFRGALVAMLIAGLVAGGCQTAPSEPMTVCEYAAGIQPADFTATQPGVFALVRWASPEGPATLPSTAQRPPTSQVIGLDTEIEEVSMDGGARIGFRRQNNQLIGFAGPTTKPLEDGHYSWVKLTQDEPTKDEQIEQQRVAAVLGVIAACTIIIPAYLGCVYLIGWLQTLH